GYTHTRSSNSTVRCIPKTGDQHYSHTGGCGKNLNLYFVHFRHHTPARSKDLVPHRQSTLHRGSSSCDTFHKQSKTYWKFVRLLLSPCSTLFHFLMARWCHLIIPG